MADILPYRASTNIEQAWAHYQRIALAEVQQPALAADITHCKAKACAWKAWYDLYTKELAA